jgi:membrane protease subunit (stomatin/prohibitin family)
MSFFDFISKQFIDVIEWTEGEENILCLKYDMADNEIQNGAQLIVRPSQMAIFVNEGVIADVFGPGRHKLTTANLPLLTNLKNWDKLFNSPFKSDIYFFSTREFTGLKWGTPSPIIIRDKELGPIRIRGFGSFSYKLNEAARFFKTIVGSKESIALATIEDQLKAVIAADLASVIGKSAIPLIDLASNQESLGETIRMGLGDDFARLGLSIESFIIENISLPEEVQKYLDKASSASVIGDMDKYTRLQAADAITIAAGNEGGMAAMGASMGVGVGVGQAIAAAMTPQVKNESPKQKEKAEVSLPSTDDALALIEKLHALKEKGILSEAEFEKKKADILSKI